MPCLFKQGFSKRRRNIHRRVQDAYNIHITGALKVEHKVIFEIWNSPHPHVFQQRQMREARGAYARKFTDSLISILHRVQIVAGDIVGVSVKLTICERANPNGLHFGERLSSNAVRLLAQWDSLTGIAGTDSSPSSSMAARRCSACRI
jgi:hypothetical protein